MTRYVYGSQMDANLIGNSFSYLSKMIFGSKKAENISLMKDLFEKSVEKVEVVPWGVNTENVSFNTPGICMVLDDNKFAIEMWGYINAPMNQHKWIEHECVHELCHSFAGILPMLDPKIIVKQGKEKVNGEVKTFDIVRENQAGLIKETDRATGESIGRHYYGKMFNETTMDMVSAMAINNFAPDITTTTIDDVLQNNYVTTGNQETGYTIFTSITRLMIAAFSNVGFQNFNYQQIADIGESIFTLKATLADGSEVKANDFLYGIMFDPLHIEQEFDKYMGDDAYRTVCQFLDGMFLEYQRTKKISPDSVKLIMNLLPDFCNKKMSDYEKRGAISEEERIAMVGNFNKIWNSMQSEYGSYFSKKDIDDIYDRAKKY